MADQRASLGERASRRRFLELCVGGLGGGVLLTACAQSVPSVSNVPTTPAARAGGTLTISIPAGPLSLDPHVAATTATTNVYQAYDTLIDVDDSGNPLPALCESFDVSADGKQYKLALRKGVYWHNGREVTSDDLKYNWQRVADPKVGAVQPKLLPTWFPNVDTPDRYTFVFSGEQPHSDTFPILATLRIANKESLEGPDANSSAVGTGPFTLAEYQQGVSFRMTRNPNYWMPGKPYLDGLLIQIQDPQSAMVALESGNLDMVSQPALQDVVRLKTDTNYTAYYPTNLGQVINVTMSVATPPVDNKLVREAIACAIDRQRIVDRAFFGIGEPHDLPFLPGSPGYDAGRDTVYSFNLEKARALITQSGVTPGALELMWSNSTVGAQTAGEIIQADLQQLGFSVTLAPLEPPVWNQRNIAHTYQLSLAPSSYGNFDPVTTIALGNTWQPTPPNSTGANDAQYKALVDAASAEVDPNKRKALFGQISDLLLDQVYVTTVATNLRFELARSFVKNVVYTSEGIRFNDTTLEK
ncbi:MAG: ABC transporter substrate-binding protein [Chloroflexi bacterium]|nr:ABC transporter substrate-binding protein [Chloroflexota bacterium]